MENDQGQILEMKEILEKFGYQIEKILTEEERQMSLIKELYDEEEEKEENNIKSKSAKDIGNNIHELKKDLKGKTVEYKIQLQTRRHTQAQDLGEGWEWDKPEWKSNI